MNIQYKTYKFSAFGDFNNIEGTPENVYELVDLFKDDKLIPSTFAELGFNLAIQPTGNIQQMPHNSRPALNSFDQKKSILLGSERLDFVIINETVYNNFAINTSTQNKYVQRFANKVFNKYDIYSNRLALNLELIIDELSESDSIAFYNKLFNSIPFYADVHLKEWSQRLASRKKLTYINKP